MANLRTALVIAIVAATAAAALAGFFFLGGTAVRLVVDGALALVLATLVFGLTSPTAQRVDALVDALRALARGERHHRVSPEEFAGLSEVARALNEVAAALTEHDDPNLGPVRSEPRKKAAPPAPPVRRTPRDAAVHDEAHADVGPVRKLKRPEAPKGSEPTAAAVDAETGRPAAPAQTNDTAIDEAPRTEITSRPPEPAKNGADASPTLPTRGELEALFAEFVEAKKAHDENVAELELEAFAQTILGECERLVAAHQCRGVRFEVTELEGEVSLRPRLLRSAS
jgi:hypothetical protein